MREKWRRKRRRRLAAKEGKKKPDSWPWRSRLLSNLPIWVFGDFLFLFLFCEHITYHNISPTNVNIMPIDAAQQGNYSQCVLLKCPEAFIFQKWSPFSSGSIVEFLKDRIFLTQLQKPGSISVTTDQRLFHITPIDCCHSW
jgi:hypothetical protein